MQDKPSNHTNIKYKDYSEAKKNWENENYNSSLELFLKAWEEKKVSIIKFFQKEKFNSDSAKAFFKSKLFIGHARLFLDYNQNHWMVDNYLKYTNDLQTSTIQFLLDKYSYTLYEILKKSTLYYKDKSFESLELYSKSHNIDQLAHILREMQYLQELRAEIEIETYKRIDPILKSFSYEMLVLTLLILESKWIIELMIEGDNDAKRAQIILTFTNNLGRLLERKLHLENESYPIKTSMRKDKEYKFKDWDINKVAIQYLEILNNPSYLQNARELIESIGRLYSLDETISKYKNENYSIDFTNESLAVLSITDKEDLIKWIKNGEKYKYQYLYYIGFTKYLDPNTAYIEDLTIPKERIQELTYHLDKNYIEQNLYLPYIEFNKHKINLSSILLFLHILKKISIEHFLSKLNDLLQGGNIKKENSFQLLQYLFSDTMIRNQNSNGMCISIRGKEEFIQSIKQNFIKNNLEINIEEVETIADLFSLDLNKTKDLNGIIAFPFFRLGNHYIINHLQLSNYELGRSIVEIAKRKIMKENEKKYSLHFEKSIHNVFENYEIPSIQGLVIQNEELETDIDLIALQDSELLIIEAKYTYIRDTYSENAIHRINQLYKAGEQLRKLEEYLSTEKGKIKILQEFHSRGKSLDSNQINKINYYIVTPTFEDDYRLIMNNFRKISFFELEMILNDSKPIMMGETINRIQTHPEELRKEFSIRNGKRPKISDIVDCIENDRIWNHLDKELENIQFEELIFETKTKKLLAKI